MGTVQKSQKVQDDRNMLALTPKPDAKLCLGEELFFMEVYKQIECLEAREILER
jgi:hypothetical protein